MSEENENVEIITKTPEKKVKIKDPKSVLAGKRLALLNKKTKEDKKKAEAEEDNKKAEAEEEKKKKIKKTTNFHL